MICSHVLCAGLPELALDALFALPVNHHWWSAQKSQEPQSAAWNQCLKIYTDRQVKRQVSVLVWSQRLSSGEDQQIYISRLPLAGYPGCSTLWGGSWLQRKVRKVTKTCSCFRVASMNTKNWSCNAHRGSTSRKLLEKTSKCKTSGSIILTTWFVGPNIVKWRPKTFKHHCNLQRFTLLCSGFVFVGPHTHHCDRLLLLPMERKTCKIVVSDK